MNKQRTVMSIIILVIVLVLVLFKNKPNSDLISSHTTYNPPLHAVDHRHQKFSEINFDDAESVLNGCTTLSNNEQCKMFFHSNEWADLDQRERDGHAYWKSMKILKKREEKTHYLCTFKYNSLESGIVTFVIIRDYNDKNDGVLFPLLFVRERDDWRMALSDVGYGKDIEMFYADTAFWTSASNMNKRSIKDEFKKIRESLKENSSREPKNFNQ